MKKLYLFAAALFSTASFSQVVISQAYGGGGNTGATYTHDFVELFNRGNAAVSLNGYSLQYASATGANWSKTDLPNVTLQPGQYFLVQQAQGAGGTTPLPSPDFVTVAGTGPEDPGNQLAMAGANFKLVLANSTTLVTSVTDAQVIDLLGVGTANGFEGTVAPALSNTTAAMRNNAGCTDTNNNASDFTVGAPAPRNSTTALNSCSLTVGNNSIAGLNVYPNPVANGNLFVTSDSNSAKSVMIYDVLGKLVVKTTVSDQAINVSSLKGGVYIVKVTEEGKTATRKLVIR
ncbi:MAG TPA: T9SS type A sorting domain-containing protein [Flavobacterium sp.]|jgi:predicted extracellular nuclease